VGGRADGILGGTPVQSRADLSIALAIRWNVSGVPSNGSESWTARGDAKTPSPFRVSGFRYGG